MGWVRSHYRVDVHTYDNGQIPSVSLHLAMSQGLLTFCFLSRHGKQEVILRFLVILFPVFALFLFGGDPPSVALSSSLMVYAFCSFPFVPEGPAPRES